MCAAVLMNYKQRYLVLRLRTDPILLENQIFRITNGFITDLLVNRVRSRISQISVKTTELFTKIEHALSEGSDARSNVTLLAQMRWCVHHRNANSARCFPLHDGH